MHQLGFHESPIFMLQLGSRQGMLDVQLGFGEQSCKLGEGTRNTRSPILSFTPTRLS